MYIGIDFLIDRGRDLYLSEINTGVPAGAFEYDLVYRQQFGKPSGVFDRIDKISYEHFSLPFKDYIRGLPYFNDLKKLKIWMDGKGDFPENPAPELKLEDKWVQYQLLSPSAVMLPTAIYRRDNKDFTESCCPYCRKFVLKRRLGRNGKGFQVVGRDELLNMKDKQEGNHILQPWIDSSAGGYAMSVRAAAFCGEFICMFASLSSRQVSNHGYRFFMEPGRKFGLSCNKFKLKEIVKKSWEAEILFGDDVPSYLEEAVMLEYISDGIMVIPEEVYSSIKKISTLVSNAIINADLEKIGEYANDLFYSKPYIP